jgi:hypothetical protein
MKAEDYRHICFYGIIDKKWRKYMEQELLILTHEQFFFFGLILIVTNIVSFVLGRTSCWVAHFRSIYKLRTAIDEQNKKEMDKIKDVIEERREKGL